MRRHVLEISTGAYRVLQQRASTHVSWFEEEPGPTQKIIVGDEAYTQIIDRAIDNHESLDHAFLAYCARICRRTLKDS